MHCFVLTTGLLYMVLVAHSTFPSKHTLKRTKKVKLLIYTAAENLLQYCEKVVITEEKVASVFLSGIIQFSADIQPEM